MLQPEQISPIELDFSNDLALVLHTRLSFGQGLPEAGVWSVAAGVVVVAHALEKDLNTVTPRSRENTRGTPGMKAWIQLRRTGIACAVITTIGITATWIWCITRLELITAPAAGTPRLGFAPYDSLLDCLAYLASMANVLAQFLEVAGMLTSACVLSLLIVVFAQRKLYEIR